jgi:hypothetical protein
MFVGYGMVTAINSAVDVTDYGIDPSEFFLASLGYVLVS